MKLRLLRSKPKLGLPYSSALTTIHQIASLPLQEQSKHRLCIQRLAEDLQSPLSEITLLYERVLIRLKAQATIQDYLPILASKKIKTLLKAARR